MEFLTDNWLWLLLLGGFLAMHLFMHRGHGGCGGHNDEHEEKTS